jgi:GNAT superfamily N-acetyltransferase
LTLVLREALPADAGTVLAFIRALAEYVRLLDEAEVDEGRIRQTLFAAQPRVFCSLAEWDGTPAGFALWYYSYSTFLGRHGIWLEDLFVSPEHRGRGIGKALLQRLAARCVEDGLGRLEWTVLDWNEPSIQFYRALGARSVDHWTRYRLSGEALLTIGAAPA